MITEFYGTEVSDKDLDKIKVGNRFKYIQGMRDTEEGQRIRYSRIEFEIKPVWLQEAEVLLEKAQKIYDLKNFHHVKENEMIDYLNQAINILMMHLEIRDESKDHN